MESMVLRIFIDSAQGFREASWAGGGRSERYCVCELAGKPKSRIQTDAVDDTRAAVWQHAAELSPFDFGDELRFSIMATNKRFKTWRACLGETNLRSYLFEQNDFEGDLTLNVAFNAEEFLMKKNGQEQRATLHVRVSSLGLKPSGGPQFVTPSPKQKQRSQEPRPLAVPAILEQCLAEAKAGAERTQNRGREQDAFAGRELEDERPAIRGEAATPEPAEVVRRIEDLPPGWEAAWDEEHERYYFYNHELERSTWTWPGDEET